MDIENKKFLATFTMEIPFTLESPTEEDAYDDALDIDIVKYIRPHHIDLEKVSEITDDEWAFWKRYPQNKRGWPSHLN